MTVHDGRALFVDRVRLYLSANSFDLDALKSNLEEPRNASRAAVFRQEFRAALDGGLSREAFERLTDLDHDTEAEYRAFLQAIWDFMYCGGPHP